MKTAIQLTMHFVRNYGSVLQTYALQKAVESVPGWRCETLDVRPHWSDGGWSMAPQTAPASVSPVSSSRSLMRRLNGIRIDSVKRRIENAYRSRFVIRPWERMFDDFLKEEINLTSRRYCSVDELKDNPPIANLYVTGSDQTFNPRFTHGEDFWFWSFLTELQSKKSRKISYASSFSCTHLRDDLRNVYRRWLPTYHALSVREASGVKIAQELGVRATHCCDPVLLLDRSEWQKFAAKGKLTIGHPYALCYNLRYAADPYPMAESIEREVSRRAGLPIVHLQESTMQWKSPTGQVLRGVSLYDFVRLFLNASFVMTSSFHGTLFALLSGAPFLTYVNENARADSRAFELLEKCRAGKHAVSVPSLSGWTGNLAQFEVCPEEAGCLCRFREDSMSWLFKEMAVVDEGGAA